MSKEIIIDKNVLQKLYIEKKYSIRKVSKKIKRGEATVLRYLKIYQIPTRPQHISRPQTRATRKKLSLAHMGKVLSEEHRKKLGLASKGRPKSYFRKFRNSNGYIMLWEPENPSSNNTGYIYQHRKVMEEYLERPLTKNEIVHHKNGVKNDNRLENLELTERKWHKDKHKSRIECPKCKFCFSLQFLNNED